MNAVPEDRTIRLQKILAEAGLGSRRYCEQLIRDGRVAVDGRVITEMGVKVPTTARITVDGKLIGAPESHVYFMVNKPVGYVSTVRDPQGRPTILDLVPKAARIYPVGRLDVDSQGLVLLTNDGPLTNALLHPGHEVEREYQVQVIGLVTSEMLRSLRRGVEVDGRKTAPARVDKIGQDEEGIWLRFVIHEGRNRQIRRMCESVGLRVRRLVRTRIGPLGLGALEVGQYRALEPREVVALRCASEPLAEPPSRSSQQAT